MFLQLQSGERYDVQPAQGMTDECLNTVADVLSPGGMTIGQAPAEVQVAGDMSAERVALFLSRAGLVALEVE